MRTIKRTVPVRVVILCLCNKILCLLVYVASLESENRQFLAPYLGVSYSVAGSVLSGSCSYQLEWCLIQTGHKNIRVLCIRKSLQTTNALSTLVRHTGRGQLFLGDMGWGWYGEETWPGSGRVQGWVKKFSLDTEESNPSVRVQGMRKQAGLCTLWGPAFHWPWLWKNKCLFVLKRVAVILSTQSNARYLISTLPQAMSFVTVIYFRAKCVSDSVCCTFTRWGIPTSSVAKKVA